MKFIGLIPFLLFMKLCGMAQPDTCLNVTELGISFPPVADDFQRDFAKVHLDFLGVKKIRIAEDWRLREPSPSEFNWEPLANRILWADANDYEVLLTIQSNGPIWACSGISNERSCVYTNNFDFKNYIDSVLIKYGDKIDKIQYGNEWQSQFWYAGNAAQFIAANNILFNAVQEHAPGTEVVLGGFTTISLRFLAACNGYLITFYDDEGEFYDADFFEANCESDEFVAAINRIDSVLAFANYNIIDLHLYDDSKLWDEYLENFADTISKPIIVTEFGGPNVNIEPYSDVYQANRLYEYIKKLDSIGISEAYFFKLVEGTANPAHATSGLMDDSTLVEKPAYYIFKSFIDCSASVYAYGYEKCIKFYPNPMQEFTTAEFNSLENSLAKLTITIYDAQGKVVLEDDIPNGKNYYIIRSANLNSGFYYVKIRTDQEVFARGKLIVQ